MRTTGKNANPKGKFALTAQKKAMHTTRTNVRQVRKNKCENCKSRGKPYDHHTLSNRCPTKKEFVNRKETKQQPHQPSYAATAALALLTQDHLPSTHSSASITKELSKYWQSWLMQQWKQSSIQPAITKSWKKASKRTVNRRKSR